MGTRADELRNDIDQQRDSIGRTVDQIENRVKPSRVIARGRYRVRRRLVDARDRVMGNDDPQYPWDARATRAQVGPYRTPPSGAGGFGETDTDNGFDDGESSNIGESAREMASNAAGTMSDAPDAVRRQTRGNPIVAGLVAFGAGVLAASVLPDTRAERRAVRNIEPQLTQAVDRGTTEAQKVAQDLKEPAQQAAEDVKAAGKEAAQNVRSTAEEHGRKTVEETREA